MWLTTVAYSSETSPTGRRTATKPMVKKIGGKWQIAFTSEIAEGLP